MICRACAKDILEVEPGRFGHVEPQRATSSTWRPHYAEPLGLASAGQRTYRDAPESKRPPIAQGSPSQVASTAVPYSASQRNNVKSSANTPPVARGAARAISSGEAPQSQTLRHPSCGRKPGRGEQRRNGRPGAALRSVTATTERPTARTPSGNGGRVPGSEPTPSSGIGS